MNKTIFYRTVLTAWTFVLSLGRFMVAYADSQQYIAMVDNLLGYGMYYPMQTHAPFYYRVLIPAIAAPLAIFTGAEAALGMISIASSLIFINIFYSICSDFTFARSKFVAFVVTCGVLVTPVIPFYGGTALVDASALMMMAAIVYFSNKIWLEQNEWFMVMLLFLIGLFIKESIVFAGIYFLLNHRKATALLTLLPGAVAYALFRIFAFGSLAQPLYINSFPTYALTHTIWVLQPLAIMSLFVIVAWVRYDELAFDSLYLMIFGFIAFLPYYFMGAYMAYFDMRFVWPLLFAFAPAATVGLSSALGAVRARWRGELCNPLCQ